MTLDEIIKKFSKRNNGSLLKAMYNGAMTSDMVAESKRTDANGVVHTVRKQVVMTVRKGADYDKLKSVIEKRDNGTLPSKNAGLVWGEWNQDYKDTPLDFLFIKHKGNDYVRLYPFANNKPHTKYFLDDVEISLDDLRKTNYLKPSFWKAHDEKPMLMETMKFLDLKKELGLTPVEQDELNALHKKLDVDCITVNIENVVGLVDC